MRAAPANEHSGSVNLQGSWRSSALRAKTEGESNKVRYLLINRHLFNKNECQIQFNYELKPVAKTFRCAKLSQKQRQGGERKPRKLLRPKKHCRSFLVRRRRRGHIELRGIVGNDIGHH